MSDTNQPTLLGIFLLVLEYLNFTGSSVYAFTLQNYQYNQSYFLQKLNIIAKFGL